MPKIYITLIFYFGCLSLFSQTLLYKSNGNLMNYQNQKLLPSQVRELLKDHERLLIDYNVGRTKKTAGNVLLWGGIGMICGKLMYNSYDSDSELVLNPNWNPSNSFSYQYIYTFKERTATLYYLGLACIIVAIPVKIGFTKKIRNVATDFNNQKATSNADLNFSKLNLITNINGIGLQLTFN